MPVTTGKAISDLNSNLELSMCVRTAMTHARAQFDAERTVIDIALNTASRKLELEAKFAKDDELRQLYEANYQRLQSQLRALRGDTDATIHIEPIVAPATHSNPEVDEAIQMAYRRLMDDRNAYFSKARERLSQNTALRPLVRAQLEKLSCTSCWWHIC